MPEKKPWDRLPNETTKAYGAFCDYIELGPERSITKLAQSRNKPGTRSWLGHWSSKYKWAKRVKAFDKDQQESHIETHKQTLEGARKMIADRVEDLTSAMLSIATGKIEAKPGQVTALQMALNRVGLTEMKEPGEDEIDEPSEGFVLTLQ